MTAETASRAVREALDPARGRKSVPGGADDDSGFGEYAEHARYAQAGFNRRIKRGPLGRARSRLLGERGPNVLSVRVPYRLMENTDTLYYLAPLDEVAYDKFRLQGFFPRRVLLDQEPEAGRSAAEEIAASLAKAVEARILNDLFDKLIAAGRGVPSAPNGTVGAFPLAGLYGGIGCQSHGQDGHRIHEWIMTIDAWIRCRSRFENMIKVRSRREASINEPLRILSNEPVRTGWLNHETAVLYGCFQGGMTVEVSDLEISDTEDKDDNNEPLASLQVTTRWAVGDESLFTCWLFPEK